MTLRLLLTAILSLSVSAAVAAERPTLRGDVVSARDAVTLGDLVDNLPPGPAETPLFRAPGLGQTGTIQTKRIVAAAEQLGLGAVETGGRMQITVTRSARHVGSDEVEAAVKKVLAGQAGLDPRQNGIMFDGAPPLLLVTPETKQDAVASDVTYDRRSHRVAATVWVGPNGNERRASLRVSGTVVELVETATVTRSLERGEALKSGDVALEYRPRDNVPPEALLDSGPFDGRVARRSLSAGTLIRTGDLIRPEIVTKGDIVTVVYEIPGMSLSMRAKVTESATLGDTVTVVNPGSKKALQAVVIGPGKVSVSTPAAGRVVASADAPAR